MPDPDFLIIGAMKCGTSTLQAQLASQAGIFMTTPKEPNYFSDDDVLMKGEGWYDSLFDGARFGDLTGEASTHYTKLPTYPHTVDRIATRLSSPKLIYMMRDPLDRAISHYIHEWTQGVIGDDPVAAFAHHPELEAYSCYAMQLAPFVEQFGREAILLLRLEQMRADPQGTLSRVGSFLGRERLVWRPELGHQNASADRIRRLPMHGLLVDNPVARAVRRRLVPQAIRQKIRQTRQITERPTLPDYLRLRLQARFAADQRQLAQMFPDDAAVCDWSEVA